MRSATVSLACSGVAWVSNLLIYTWHPAVLILALDLISVGFTIAAFVLAVRAVRVAWWRLLPWLAVAVSLIYPVWLAFAVFRLSGDAF